MDRMTDEELNAELDRFRAVEPSAPMTDAQHAVWLAETKAKIAVSLADPRPAVPIDEAFERLHRELDALHLREDEAA